MREGIALPRRTLLRVDVTSDKEKDREGGRLRRRVVREAYEKDMEGGRLRRRVVRET